jgi:uncharacterized membrane protein YeaQ/YmgE (transglycosylase-associated protein family)
MFVNLVCWMALGLVAGFIASRLIDQRADDPKLGIVLAGVAAVIGGILYGMFTAEGVKAFNASCLVGAAVGAVVGVGLWNVIRGFAARA